MKRGSWSARVVVRYTLLQLPFTVFLVVVLIWIRRWIDLPAWFVCGLVALWVLKDIVLFPFVWRSYDPDRPSLMNSMKGARGIALNDLDPVGHVEIRGERWKAEVLGNDQLIQRGEGVRICGIRGLTLLVQPDSDSQ